MKSVKPGRGPSFMNGVGYVAAAVFGIFWMILAGGIGAGGLGCLLPLAQSSC